MSMSGVQPQLVQVSASESSRLLHLEKAIVGQLRAILDDVSVLCIMQMQDSAFMEAEAPNGNSKFIS